jgi:hypothetical protein
MGEEGITDLITSAQEVRNGLQKAYDENRLHEQQETEDKLKAARQASEQQTYQDAVDLTNHLQEEYREAAADECRTCHVLWQRGRCHLRPCR